MRLPRIASALLLSIFLGIPASSQTTPGHPLSDREVVSLLVGGVVPQTIVADVESRGISFDPNAALIPQLRSVQTDEKILTALLKAKVSPVKSEDQHVDDPAVLDHLLVAWKELQRKRTEQAAEQVASATRDLDDHPEVSFAMADLLRREGYYLQARKVYSELLKIDDAFPQAHTKLAYICYKLDDPEQTINEANAALKLMPADAEAHRNLAIGLDRLQKYDAAIDEYHAALKLDPSYARVYYALGNLYFERKDYTNAIANYRKSLALDPGDADCHSNLGLALQNAGERGAALDEYRAAIRVDPDHSQARRNLAFLLTDLGRTREGVEEFRTMVRLHPESEYCHQCFGELLYKDNQLDEAAAEFKKAEALDPQDAIPHFWMAFIYRDQHQLQKETEEFLIAEKLDPEDPDTHRQLAIIYQAAARHSDAVRELKQGLNALPADANMHSMLGSEYEALGQLDDAISEYRQAVTLSSAGEISALRLAALLEKKGDPAAALAMYRKAYEAKPADPTFRTAYEEANKRLNGSKSGESTPAATMTASVESNIRHEVGGDNHDLLIRLQQVSRERDDAVNNQEWKHAEEAGREAISIAEKLDPQDQRLVEAIKRLGGSYEMRRKYTEAEQEYLRALQVSTKLFGPNSLPVASSMTSLAQLYLEEQNYSQALDYANRALGVEDRMRGAGGDIAELELIGEIYREQGALDKARDTFKRELGDMETALGTDKFALITPLERLGMVSSDLGDYEQANAYFLRMLNLSEKQFGQNSPMLAPVLDHLAQTARRQGQTELAQTYDHRREALK